MNFVDLIVIAVIAISALLALARGFVKEVLSILGWVGALIAAFLLYPHAVPLVQTFIADPLFAKIAAGAGIFLVALLLCGLLNNWISGKVRGNGLSSLDRSLGLVFGLVRGALIVSLGYILVAWAFRDPADWPEAIRTARSLPLARAGAALIQARLPADLLERGQAAGSEMLQQGQDKLDATVQGVIQEKASELLPAVPAAPPQGANGQKPGSGYNDSERQGLDQLIEGAQ